MPKISDYDEIVTLDSVNDSLLIESAATGATSKISPTNLLAKASFTEGTPANASATGVKGTIKFDSSYIYICIATNTWKRVAISTW